MKHTLKITCLLVLIFLVIQIFGLFAINENIVVAKKIVGNQTITKVEYLETAIGERPKISGLESFLYLIFGILLGTCLLLLIIKFGKINLWKLMYFFAILLTCTITLGVFINSILAFLISFILAIFKTYRPNVYIHNLTELFVYPGIAILFVPLFNLFWITLLLLVISGYDMFAVWKSKHMIKLAKFQTKVKAFAGFMIPYELKLKGKIAKGGKRVKVAVLGGGDIAFPLLFSGVAMDYLIKIGITKSIALLQTLVISLFVSLTLFILLTKAKRERFYPAMPFLTLGCLAGFGFLFLINLFVLV